MKKHTTIAVDIAKNVFEIAVSAQPGRVSDRKRCSRSQMLAFFRGREPSAVVLEACGAAHELGRSLTAMGHTVRLLPPAHVRRYVLGSKTDAADATALLEANRNEQIIPVPVKTVAQQSLGAIHRMRSAWLRTRTARLNLIRGLLRELGVTSSGSQTRSATSDSGPWGGKSPPSARFAFDIRPGRNRHS